MKAALNCSPRACRFAGLTAGQSRPECGRLRMGSQSNGAFTSAVRSSGPRFSLINDSTGLRS